jgi:hypothetical protein
VLVEADLRAVYAGDPGDRLLTEILITAYPPHSSAEDVGETRV